MSTASSANNTTAGLSLGGAGLGAWGGAAAASALALTGPVGWGVIALGAGLGMVTGGSIGSFLGGKKAGKKQKRALEAAQAIQRQRESNAAEEQMLQYVREARIARSGSLASAVSANISTSSLTSAALSSIGSQSTHNMQYTAEDRRLYDLYSMYMAEAGQAAAQYQSIVATGQLWNALGSTAMTAGQTISTVGSIKDNTTTNQTTFKDSLAKLSNVLSAIKMV